MGEKKTENVQGWPQPSLDSFLACPPFTGNEIAEIGEFYPQREDRESNRGEVDKPVTVREPAGNNSPAVHDSMVAHSALVPARLGQFSDNSLGIFFKGRALSRRRRIGQVHLTFDEIRNLHTPRYITVLRVVVD